MATAPWPVLARIAARQSGPWVVWGALPAAVARALESRGVEIHAEPLPAPFHLAELPAWVRRPWRDIVVPSLGHPIPNRVPIAKHLAALGCPLVVSHGERLAPIDLHLLRAPDAFTWAFERVRQPPAARADGAADGTTCVRVDLLGDLLLATPAFRAAASREPLRVVCREEWLPFLALGAAAGQAVRGRGVDVRTWTEPALGAAHTVVDLSPPGWASPLTQAVARAIPAADRRVVPSDVSDRTLAEQAAAALGVAPAPTPRVSRDARSGLLVAGGSSGERWLPPAYWRSAIEQVGRATGVTRWLVTADGREDDLVRALPDARSLPFPLRATDLPAVLGASRVVVGTSSGLTHLATVAGVPGLVVEHPTTRPGWYRLSDADVVYVRPARPWWHDAPDEDDVRRALDDAPDSYGFEAGEWEETIAWAVERIGVRVGEA